MKQRLSKILARAGVASRRDAERMIAAGRVTLNGRVVERQGVPAGPDDRILIDGEPLPAKAPSRLWRYHKPAGLITAARDPQGRPTVFERLPKDLPRVITVGRLDLDTEGLLLLTNDGSLARFLEHPANGFTRTYRVRAFGRPAPEALQALADGVAIEGFRYRPAEVTIERQVGANCWLTVTLLEGKNREVKRLLTAVGLRVNRLIRVGYGPFSLDSLARGAVAPVSASELRRGLARFFTTR